MNILDEVNGSYDCLSVAKGVEIQIKFTQNTQYAIRNYEADKFS